MSGGKRAASQPPTKPRISSNLDRRRRGPERSVRNGPGVVAAATRVSGKPHAIGKKTRSGGKAVNEVSGATILKSPVGRLVSVRTDTPVQPRNASDESLDDVSSKCKEAGGAQDNFIREDDEDEDDEDDADEDDDEEDVEVGAVRLPMPSWRETLLGRRPLLPWCPFLREMITRTQVRWQQHWSQAQRAHGPTSSS